MAFNLLRIKGSDLKDNSHPLVVIILALKISSDQFFNF